MLSKGDKHFTHTNVCKNLDFASKSLGLWKVIPLEKKKVYEFVFSSLEVKRVLEVGSWQCGIGISIQLESFCLYQRLCVIFHETRQSSIYTPFFLDDCTTNKSEDFFW